VAIQKYEKHGVEYGDFDIQLDQGGQIVDGFSKVDRFGVEVHLFDFGVGFLRSSAAYQPKRRRRVFSGCNVRLLFSVKLSVHGGMLLNGGISDIV